MTMDPFVSGLLVGVAIATGVLLLARWLVK
jgi:hypothetical protein